MTPLPTPLALQELRIRLNKAYLVLREYLELEVVRLRSCAAQIYAIESSLSSLSEETKKVYQSREHLEKMAQTVFLSRKKADEITSALRKLSGASDVIVIEKRALSQAFGGDQQLYKTLEKLPQSVYDPKQAQRDTFKFRLKMDGSTEMLDKLNTVQTEQVKVAGQILEENKKVWKHLSDKIKRMQQIYLEEDDEQPSESKNRQEPLEGQEALEESRAW